MKRWKAGKLRWLLAVCLVLALLAVTVAVLVYRGVIWLNNPSEAKYPVRGVDVSHYQGVIDWQMLASQDLSFAFIKATEGSSFVDPCFAENYAGAKACGLAVGFYHFFSFDSAGAAQAEQYIRTVKPFDGMLPPVIDLEFYGDKADDPPNRDTIASELQVLLAVLETHYGVKPILYVTEATYARYLSGAYADYDIWIRGVYSRPKLADQRSWTFWQFTNRARLEGYQGQERYIDLNVFCGSLEEFLAYPRVSAGK